MKPKNVVFSVACVIFANIFLLACDFNVTSFKRTITSKSNHVGEISFENSVASSDESDLFKLGLPNPEGYLIEESHRVIQTLYFPEDDSIPYIQKLNLVLKDFGDGSEVIASKHNDNESSNKTIEYNTRWVTYSFSRKDTAYLKSETKGVLCHELTHVYQLRPQGIGDYYTNRIYWAYVEGMADAVRCMNGYFDENDRKSGGNYTEGFRYTGFFFVWLAKNKDKDFIRKINRSTQFVIPWSFDGAIKYALGDQYNIDQLWLEYLQDMGDITPEMAEKLEKKITYVP